MPVLGFSWSSARRSSISKIQCATCRTDFAPTIIIHAGFGKCGSASIRAALLQNFSKLRHENVLIPNKDLKIARTPDDLLGTPIWVLEKARKKSENLTQKLTDEIGSVGNRKIEHLAILSAEKLGESGNGSTVHGARRPG
jgi:hypothetical protein